MGTEVNMIVYPKQNPRSAAITNVASDDKPDDLVTLNILVMGQEGNAKLVRTVVTKEQLARLAGETKANTQAFRKAYERTKGTKYEREATTLLTRFVGAQQVIQDGVADRLPEVAAEDKKGAEQIVQDLADGGRELTEAAKNVDKSKLSDDERKKLDKAVEGFKSSFLRLQNESKDLGLKVKFSNEEDNTEGSSVSGNMSATNDSYFLSLWANVMEQRAEMAKRTKEALDEVDKNIAILEAELAKKRAEKKAEEKTILDKIAMKLVLAKQNLESLRINIASLMGALDDSNKSISQKLGMIAELTSLVGQAINLSTDMKMLLNSLSDLGPDNKDQETQNQIAGVAGSAVENVNIAQSIISTVYASA